MKKKLIMILCAVVSLSLAACGGTVETDSDSRTEREVEDDDSRDKEDKEEDKESSKDKKKESLLGKLVENAKENEMSTILDEIVFYETTVDAVKQMMHDRHLNYEEEWEINKPQVSTQIVDSFLGYDAYYDFYAQPIYRIYDEMGKECYQVSTREDNILFYADIDSFIEQFPLYSHYDYDSYFTGEESVRNITVRLFFENDEEFKEAGGVLENYMKSKAISQGEIAPYFAIKLNESLYPIQVTELNDVICIEYFNVATEYSENNSIKGYCNNNYKITYGVLSESGWKYLEETYGLNDTAESEISTETIEDEKELQFTDYKDAYSYYLRNYVPDEGMEPYFYLDYVDDDDIPELFIIEGNGHANCVKMYTYMRGEIVKIGDFGEYGGMSYAPKESIFINTYSGMGMFTTEYLRLNSGSAEELCTLSGVDIDLPESKYYINDVQVSEAECNAKEAELDALVSGFKYIHYEDAYEITEDNLSWYLFEQEDDKVSTAGTPAITKTLSDIDVESEVATIRDYYYTTQNNLGSYMLEEHQNLTMYHEAGYPVKIFVKSGYNDWDYTREYFYHDQELYFAFVYNNNEQHRLYFKDGIMIRYIDENGNTYDYGSLDAYSDWADNVKNESNGIYPTMPNCGA